MFIGVYDMSIDVYDKFTLMLMHNANFYPIIQATKSV